MSFARHLKAWVVPQLLLGYIFVMSGLVVCALMAVCTVLWPISRSLYRKVVTNLAYAHWCQLTFLAQWWSGTECLLHMSDEDVKHVGKEHVLVIMNHKYDVDWLMTWILSERFGILGGTKVFAKQTLRFVPLIGWAWYFTETIFLKRKLEEDMKVIKHSLSEIVQYPEGYWVTLLLFPEGTRFTEEKLKASQEVCAAKGYPMTKHTLLPRTKGFCLSMTGMKGRIPALYNATVAFPASGPAPTMMNIISGVPLLAHFHCQRVPMEDVPTDTEEECGEWLRKVFKKKDELYEEFVQTGSFPLKGRLIPWRYHDLLMWVFWALLTCVPLFHYIAQIFIAGTLTQQVVLVACLVIGSVGVRKMIGVTETQHSSSSYGKADQKAEPNGKQK